MSKQPTPNLRTALVAAITLTIACAAPRAFAQNSNANDNGSATSDFDACGTLVRGATCVLFEGGGGKYFVPDTGKFQVGDFVRAVGTLDAGCITICADADGCIRGGILYDPALFPCGTPIRVQFDPCAGLGTGLTFLSVGGLWLTWPRKSLGPNLR